MDMESGFDKSLMLRWGNVAIVLSAYKAAESGGDRVASHSAPARALGRMQYLTLNPFTASGRLCAGWWTERLRIGMCGINTRLTGGLRVELQLLSKEPSFLLSNTSSLDSSLRDQSVQRCSWATSGGQLKVPKELK